MTVKRIFLRPGDGIKSKAFVEPVKELQQLLIKLKLLPESEPVDGEFDSKVEKAVCVFQMRHDLEVNGIVGLSTWAEIDRVLGISRQRDEKPTSEDPVDQPEEDPVADPVDPPKEEPDDKPLEILRFPVLKRGDGLDYPELREFVLVLQQYLKDAGIFPPDEILDGKFGSNTEAAVKRFQAANGLLVDGWVGRETWSVLVNGPVRVYQPDRPKEGVGNFDIPRIIASIPYPDIRVYARESLPLILQSCLDNGVTDLGQIAYVLATAEHESHMGKWMRELASGWDYEWRSDLGNIYAGDGPLYKGRGFVQITGRANYRHWSARLGIDLIANPDLAAQKDIAAKILVLGMRDGSYTGYSLSDFIAGSVRDFYNARKIVNWLDRAAHIAGIAREYLRALE
ncbi:peptidoglycan-binding protein [Baaleninema sp.]|uniref:peptidoglycan-binding protein n=1 Tax=Baaleninema sp. TaxID=3101197 RepID=UPI003D0575F2